jgi:hypothetical protein
MNDALLAKKEAGTVPTAMNAEYKGGSVARGEAKQTLDPVGFPEQRLLSDLNVAHCAGRDGVPAK